MNKELIKLKKELMNSIKRSKEDIQGERLQRLLLNARNSKNIDIKLFSIELDSIFKGEE